MKRDNSIWWILAAVVLLLCFGDNILALAGSVVGGILSFTISGVVLLAVAALVFFVVMAIFGSVFFAILMAVGALLLGGLTVFWPILLAIFVVYLLVRKKPRAV
ncbi:hypothetical protein [Idiomarina xiamenensis]|uniref:Uncharacterized protein n=1 Tax=Idiomarina xiamenensis 10-D-4 TaxID=740709 RepID=K2KHF4_9GAMM|nr:hypothetical protein [Idiomarina xiamenensis]EKE87433.1 hypothetical protein A10D4_00015 [Idiomarina xiamenensis 10-D-4]